MNGTKTVKNLYKALSILANTSIPVPDDWKSSENSTTHQLCIQNKTNNGVLTP